MIVLSTCLRSGSVYLQDLLRRHGIVLGHERPARAGMVGFPFDVIRQEGIDGALGLYPPAAIVIRHPEACIASCLGRMPHLGPWICQILRLSPDLSLTNLFAHLWLAWNGRLVATGAPAFRLRDLRHPERTAALLKAVGFSGQVAVLPFDRGRHNAGAPASIADLVIAPDLRRLMEDLWAELSSRPW